jgi:hypothetical protein
MLEFEAVGQKQPMKWLSFPKEAKVKYKIAFF